MALLRVALAAAAACSATLAAAAVIGCTADEDCMAYAATPRCLPSTNGQGLPCMLDYAFNESGICACASQPCVPFSHPNTTDKLQWLVIGDSISLGYTPVLQYELQGSFEVTHAPSFSTGSENNDNAWWHRQCAMGWLGPDPHRWDVVSINAGLHDLAFPDNEHLSIASYGSLVAGVLAEIAGALRPEARLIWARTTPVPTAPNASCVLIPGRLQSSVTAYNAAADAAVVAQRGRVASCDLEGVINTFCGVGYSTCSILQSPCGGPHFNEQGWGMLADQMVQCATA